MTQYIYSTLTGDQQYAKYKKLDNPKMVPVIERVFFVNGMCNVLNPKTMMTPSGAVTAMSDDDYKELEKLSGFKQHMQGGFITVSKSREEPGKVAKGMTPKDLSAQLDEKDFKEDKQPIVNKAAS